MNAGDKREYQLNWRARHKDRMRAYRKKWNDANRMKVKLQQKLWRDTYPERAAASRRNWRLKNLRKINIGVKQRCIDNPSYRLSQRLQRRVRGALKGIALKVGSTIGLTGCNIQFLRAYLEARFSGGMDWSNYGKMWEIDHIIPCAAFDLTRPDNQRACFSYTNLRPLLRSENRRKHSKMPPPHQAELV